VSKIEQDGRSSSRRPKLPIKGGSATEEEKYLGSCFRGHKEVGRKSGLYPKWVLG